MGGEEVGKGQTGPGPSVEAAATKELQDKVTWSLKMTTLPLCVCVCVCVCVCAGVYAHVCFCLVS